jgi:uncharacterized protein YbjT (DUF2867 family)
VGRDADRLVPLVELGAEAVVGSVTDPDILGSAFAGAAAAYVMIPPSFDAEDYRLFQSEVGTVVAGALERAGVRHVVSLSSIGVQHPAGTGPIGGLRELESHLDALGIHALHLRAGYFMENFFNVIPMIRGTGLVGMPIAADIPISMIAARDVGAYAAIRLLALDFEDTTTQELLGPRDVSMGEATRILGAAIGKPGLQYVQFPYQQAEQGLLQMGLSAAGAAMLMEMYWACNQGLVAGEEARAAENTTPTSLEEFAVEFASAYGS